jgi:Malectin domain
MSLEVLTVMHSEKAPADAVKQREELVRRVASSVTFEKSPRLRAFFLHVCRCARENKSEEATEPQIAIYVYGRQPGYNPNDDNIVRSQARVLRMKLEHHFANEGRDEPVIITIPKGQYLPIFETRTKEPQAPPLYQQPTVVVPQERKPGRSRQILAGAAAVFVLGVIWLGFQWFAPKGGTPQSSAVPTAPFLPRKQEAEPQRKNQPLVVAPDAAGTRIAAGHTGESYVDFWGRRWESDRYYKGGVPKPGPLHFFPPVADENLYSSIREAVSDDIMVPQSQREFQYNIPVSPGVYELRLYFADPLRLQDGDRKQDAQDAQNTRHLQVELNGHPLLADFDPVADGGSAAVDIRAFKDVRPAADGEVHLVFRSDWGRAFVSALELMPGTPGKSEPIRIWASRGNFVDANGVHWSGDRYFIDGRTYTYANPEIGPRIPDLYTGERHGNFSYAIPVAPGSYTVKLHFLEAFFSPLIPAAHCHGVGCRVFDVTCNGIMLLQDFDIVREAPGAFQPVVREFHGLHPNGQGKLLISFSPKVNYAEVRAIEVLDEAQ